MQIGEEAVAVTAVDNRSGRLFNRMAEELALSDRRFAELAADCPRAEYRTLAVWTGPGWRAPGMREAVGELRGLCRTQAMTVFFIPFLAGLVHSTFAMKALGTLVGRSVLLSGWVVALRYLELYVGFFRLTYALYWRALQIGRAGDTI